MDPEAFIAHKLDEARRALVAAELDQAATAVKVALDYALLVSRDHPAVVEALRLKAMVHGRIAAEAEQLAESLLTVTASLAGPQGDVVLERMPFAADDADAFERGKQRTDQAVAAAQTDGDWSEALLAARQWLFSTAAANPDEERLVTPLAALGAMTAAMVEQGGCTARAWLEGFFAANIVGDEASVQQLCSVDLAGLAAHDTVPEWVILHIVTLVALRTGQEGLPELAAQTRDLAQQQLHYEQRLETALYAPSHLLMMEVLAGTAESFNANLLNAVGVHHDYYREHAPDTERWRGALALGPVFYARMAHNVHGWPVRVRSDYIPGWLLTASVGAQP